MNLKKKNIAKYLLTALGITVMSSCADFLEEYSQDTYYVKSYEDLDELLIGDCYLPVKRATTLESTSDVGYFIHFLADEVEQQNSGISVNYSKDYEKIYGYYTWQMRAGETDTHNGYQEENSTWTECYRLINVANNIIESVKGVPQQLESEKLGAKRVNGEAHFLRAAYYFFLVNLYAKPYVASTAKTDLGIPVKTEDKVNDKIYTRNTVQEVYDQILADLQEAENDLSQTGKAKSLYRADSTAVHLLQSRVYLYMQNWDMAAKYADKVLKVRKELADLNTRTDAFATKENEENIFSMGGMELSCSLSYEYKSFRIAQDLYTSYSNDDLRKSKWYWSYNEFVGITKREPINVFNGTTDPSNPYYYYYNYGAYSYSGTQSPVSDKFLYRTAEAYLNKAEANAYLGNEDEARNALNTLRKNRYATGTDYEVTATGQELVKAIREERRRELALEGHRWFDLRRYGVCEKYPESKEITHEYTYYLERGSEQMVERHRFVLEPNDPGYTLGIPHEVLDYNTGMPNNERKERTFTVVPLN